MVKPQVPVTINAPFRLSQAPIRGQRILSPIVRTTKQPTPVRLNAQIRPTLVTTSQPQQVQASSTSIPRQRFYTRIPNPVNSDEMILFRLH